MKAINMTDVSNQSATDRRVIMALGLISREQADGLRTEGIQPTNTAGLQELVVGVAGGADQAATVIAAYGLATDPVQLDDTLRLVGVEPSIADALRPAELLFHWEDEERRPADRGMAIAALSVIPMASESAAKLRDLIAELVAGQLPGLAEMARRAGYYREAMALVKGEDGAPALLLYLELVDHGMRERLRALPPTDFMRWWAPRFTSLVSAPDTPPTEIVFRHSTTI